MGENPKHFEEERRISEEYQLWKRNAPLLYDMVLTHVLEWPSLSVQWLPGKVESSNYSKQQLLLGTHTTNNEQNYLLVVETQVPKSDLRPDDTEPPIGFNTNANRLEVKQKIKHDGEVNKARAMPQRPNIVATKTGAVSSSTSVDSFVFDLTTAASDDGPLVKLRGLKKEGYGLEWNPNKAGTLCGTSDDQTVCVWDVMANVDRRGRGDIVDFNTQLVGHSEAVTDVSWHPTNDALFASVSDDKSIKLWDIRAKNCVGTKLDAHQKEINSIEFNTFSEYAFVTAGADKTVAVWDKRKPDKARNSLYAHEEEVFSVQWSPFNETILASSSADRRICIWDISKIGAEQASMDDHEGPPELLFVHAGHTGRVSDMAWNKELGDDWVIASVGEDNVLQTWKIAENIYNLEQEDPEGEPGGDGVFAGPIP